MKVLADQIFNLKERILFETLQEEGIVFHLGNRMVHTLNRTGAGILHLLDGHRNVREVIQAFSRMCEQPEEVLRKDVEHFLSDLYERGWLMLNERHNLLINQEIVLREEEGGAFLFEPDTGRLCHLNALGTSIWKLCRKPITSAQIIDEICKEYPATPQEQISKDCLLFLEELDQLGFFANREDHERDS
ncbi:MAG: hypothetical protein CO150_08480 [Nitrospirae bacterium CG_4_9_14_3_um_filter_53_35]|nr:MAG: hypothetical protein AUK29_05980 [Nitrospirae bacterium CG2_30_53_67]PIS36698.1 MAG: hypothetical protein COT35_09890 [Nitrospirae bacterium CG08_land_8_20_14_0_20_52_24]PIV82347.1 MAG: hypothetical protein COW52_14025 [Nitrospirae bacterium CG17_big_fil_post_rev_8_21_14_2_50_50_9]PIW85946.1 MAG: hypothetical protein COZ95_01925 [Nitrospirae bacterium CG_4_8_14_3_um_filter_50_41]PIX85498.1 MAG: hypothetical protein COZ32_08140 [Nitrospirae bacterium CG_4_10_14_3_um_filter_53_41]PJA7311